MKRLICILSAIIIILASSVNVKAATLDEGLATPRYIPDEREYVHKSTTYSNSENWTHESNNPTGIVQSTNYSVSRTAKADFRVKYSETVDAMIAKVGLDIEVSIGTQVTITESHTYNIPPYSKYKLIYGSKLVKESGYENLWQNGKLTSSTLVYGNWSYMSYDDMVKIN